MYLKIFELQYIVVREVFFIFYGGMKMNSVATMEALDSHIIRSILRSMINEHWSVSEALDEYDIPEDQRAEYEAQIEECFVD